MRYYSRLLAESRSSYFAKVEELEVPPDMEELEDAWRGGVANFGDPTAGNIIQLQPEFPEYQAKLQKIAQQTLGSNFVAWRSASVENAEDLLTGTSGEAVSVTLDKALAFHWHKLAQNKGPRVVLEIHLQPRAVVMRGAAEESELVVDSSWISAPDIKVIQGAELLDPDFLRLARK